MSALAELIEQALIDHRLAGATQPPWYLRRPRVARIPKDWEQTYRCKCREWEGTHAAHTRHVAEVIAALVSRKRARS